MNNALKGYDFFETWARYDFQGLNRRKPCSSASIRVHPRPISDEVYYTPKHGSWLNMAEIELSALVRTCLKRRIPDKETLRREVQAWADEWNQKAVRVEWHFTTADARTKLKRLYPKIHD
jgi:transposase